LKNFLASPPVVKKTKPDKRLLLYISVSKDAVEVALVQEGDG